MTAANPRSISILIADDDADDRLMAKEALDELPDQDQSLVRSL